MTEDVDRAQRHAQGKARMAEVYAWDDVPEVAGDFFAMTVDHLFGEVWSRDGLSIRDRRMLLLGVIAALGEWSVLPIQVDAILSNDEMTAAELREVVVFLTHYVGWPRGSSLNGVVEERVSAHRGRGAKRAFPGSGDDRR
ncbi:MAG TPA: carboxymuconolactone decarboxylase family protein [Mycobacteriales bacterium]|nr:carboxymuconolactone decarboxylase family protein [Mycobacteriales bacterium]